MELEQYFPSIFKKARGESIMFNSNKLRILRGEVDLVLDSNDSYARNNIFEGEKGILSLHKPSSWNIYVSGNMEREMEIEFEKFLINVNENTNSNIDEVTVFRFYTTLEYLKEKHKPK